MNYFYKQNAIGAALSVDNQTILCLFTTHYKAKQAFEYMAHSVMALTGKAVLKQHDWTILFENGSTIICRSEPEKIRGLDFNAVFVDETPDEETQMLLRSRMLPTGSGAK